MLSHNLFKMPILHLNACVKCTVWSENEIKSLHVHLESANKPQSNI